MWHWQPVLPYLPSLTVWHWQPVLLHLCSLSDSDSQYYPISHLLVCDTDSEYYPIFHLLLCDTDSHTIPSPLSQWQRQPVLPHLPSLTQLLCDSDSQYYPISPFSVTATASTTPSPIYYKLVCDTDCPNYPISPLSVTTTANTTPSHCQFHWSVPATIDQLGWGGMGGESSAAWLNTSLFSVYSPVDSRPTTREWVRGWWWLVTGLMDCGQRQTDWFIDRLRAGGWSRVWLLWSARCQSIHWSDGGQGQAMP